MKKGITLVEMIVLIAVLPAAMIVLSRFFATFIRDIPRMTRVVERNTTVLDMVQQLRDDLGQATALPDTFEGKGSGEQTLLVELPEGVVCYELQAGCAVRSVLTDGEAGGRGACTWKFPEAEIAWSRWRQDDNAYAVEIHTHVNQKVGSQTKAKLANSYVLFLPDREKNGWLP